MRNIEIKENGSMWQLATLWGNESLPSDGCGLVWKCLFHLFLIIVGTILTGAFLGDLVASTIASIVTCTFVWGVSILILSLSLAVLAIILVVFTPLFIWEEADEDSDNTIMKTIYNMKTIKMGWKDKFCPVVKEVY